MAIVEGIQISIPVAGRRASAIIQAMEDTLTARHHGRISRWQFLGRWKKLRVALRLTKEYQDLRTMVLARNGGLCEICSEKPSIEMHHKARVALHPRLALVPVNCQGVCKKCHKSQPGHR